MAGLLFLDKHEGSWSAGASREPGTLSDLSPAAKLSHPTVRPGLTRVAANNGFPDTLTSDRLLHDLDARRGLRRRGGGDSGGPRGRRFESLGWRTLTAAGALG